jgi:hypothetical protein
MAAGSFSERELAQREQAALQRMALAAGKLEHSVSPKEHLLTYSLAAFAGGLVCGFFPSVRKSLMGLLDSGLKSCLNQMRSDISGKRSGC